MTRRPVSESHCATFNARQEAGAIEQPEAARGVLHKVADDPVQSEKLGDGGDILGEHGAFASHEGVFFLRDVELVKPAEDFDFLPIRLLAAAHELADHGVGVQEVIRQLNVADPAMRLNQV